MLKCHIILFEKESGTRQTEYEEMAAKSERVDRARKSWISKAEVKTSRLDLHGSARENAAAAVPVPPFQPASLPA